MNTDERRQELDHVSYVINGCAFKVANTLGAGFLEKVYENALIHELRKAGLNVKQQAPVEVSYDGIIVGEYFADILVNDSIIIELKAMKDLDDAHMAQCINYLKATGLTLCLLMNFAKPKLDFRRIVHGF